MCATATHLTPARVLRGLLSDESKTLIVPGVYDGISARVAMAHGFQCLYMTGAGTSMSRLGMADLGLATFTDMHQNAAMIASIDPSLPLIADADTGYGGPINIARTVKAYAQAGVAGLHIEDQVQEKRCGHLSGKLLVSRDIFYSRLRAACRARDESKSDIVIFARTDARAGVDTEGQGGFEEAIARLRKAVEIGVDGIFFEALQSREEAESVASEFPHVPILLNMVPGGRTPIMTLEEAHSLGFRLVIWPTLGLEAIVPALSQAYQTLKTTGRNPLDQEMGPGKLFEVCGLRELMDLDRAVGGSAYDVDEEKESQN